MARMARIVVKGLAHHIVQRGNRRQAVFFNDEDRRTYLEYLSIFAKTAGVRIWGYCLMDNHVHLIAVPEDENSFARGLAEAHRRYTRRINFREGWRGYLWEGRFKSYPLSEAYLYAAMRYVERNPVRAGIAKNPWDYPWSSARAHVFKQNDIVLDDNYMVDSIRDWKAFITVDETQAENKLIRLHANTGRPLGGEQFVKENRN